VTGASSFLIGLVTCFDPVAGVAQPHEVAQVFESP
jgi:hypothetical protein